MTYLDLASILLLLASLYVSVKVFVKNIEGTEKKEDVIRCTELLNHTEQQNDFSKEIDILKNFESLIIGKPKYKYLNNNNQICPLSDGWYSVKAYRAISNIVQILYKQNCENENYWFFLDEKLLYDINEYLKLTESIHEKFISEDIAETYKDLMKNLANQIVCWEQTMMTRKQIIEQEETKYLVEYFNNNYCGHKNEMKCLNREEKSGDD